MCKFHGHIHTTSRRSNFQRMSAMDVPSIITESLPPWLRIVVIGAAVMAIIHFELLRYLLQLVREVVWIPWMVMRRMRKLGYSGPSVHLFSLQELPPKEPSQTGSGLSHEIEPQILALFSTWRAIYGEKFLFKRRRRVHLHTFDPEAIKEITSTKSDELEKFTSISVLVHILGSKGLVFAEHEEWARQRRVVRPAFYPGRSKKMVVEMASWVEVWLQRLDNLVVDNQGSFEVDMFPKLVELTTDVLARSSFGSGFAKGKEGFRHHENHKNLMLKQGRISNPLSRLLPTALKKEISKENEEILRCLREIIQERRSSIQSRGVYGDDMLGLLLADRDRRLAVDGRPPGEGETEDEHITDQCRTFFFAGSDTVQSAIIWAIVFLGHYIDWQDRIRAEVQEAFQGSSPDENQLVKLKQLTMFVNETLRLYCPVPILTREVVNNHTSLLGEALPKHLVIMMNYFALHREKEYWGEDALEFKPERFSNGISKASKIPNAFVPFGGGPRICVAQAFAMVEVKLVLAMLVQRFSFSLSSSYRHQPVLGITIYPKFGAQVVLQRV